MSIHVRRHGKLLLYSLVFSVTCIVVGGHSAQALAGIDPKEILHGLQPSNVSSLPQRQKAEKPKAASKKVNSSDSKAPSTQASPSLKPSAPSGAGESAPPVQPIVGDLAPLSTIDTPLPPYPYSNLPHGLLVKSNIATLAVAADKPGAPVLAASSQGWKVAGLAWYWWLVILGLVVGAGRWRLYRRRAMAQDRARQ